MINDKDFSDDGRVVADMSMIEKPTFFGTLFGRRFDEKRAGRDREDKRKADERTPEITIDREERRAMIGGALKASFLIGFSYLAGIGVIIGLLVLIWTR